jgi:hypothetical protein
MKTRYLMEDGTILVPSKAIRKWNEETDWDGNNHISRATGSQWEHETLYQSLKGRFYIVHHSQWQGSLDYAEIKDPREATAWLLLMEYELPEELVSLENEIAE